MNPILLAIPVFLLSIGIEAWIAKRQGRQVYSLSDAIASLNIGVLSQVSGLFSKLITLGIYAGVYELWAMTQWSLDSVWAWLGALLLYDLCYYWNHRLGHEVSLLWGAHSIHHSSEYYNLSTALRQSATGFLWSWVFYLPLAIAGIPPKMLVIVGLIDLLYQYWVHTELIGRLGWLDRVLVTPSNHRVHHGQNDYCIDKNYGGILVVWDRLFGTFVEERVNEPIVYGIRKPLHSFNPLWANAMHYADLCKQWQSASGWGDKMRSVWGSPSTHAADSLPFRPSAFVRYAPKTPRILAVYATLQYALLVPIFMGFLFIFEKTPLWTSVLYGLWLCLSVLCISGLLENKAWARWCEALRWLAAGLALAQL